MTKRKAYAIATILLLVISLIPTGFSTLSQSQIPLKNVFPTLVPKEITYYQESPLFLLKDNELLTASGNTIPLPIQAEKIGSIEDKLLIYGKHTLYTFNIKNSTTSITATNIVYMAPDFSGYATLKSGYLHIFSIQGTFMYQVAPPITSFSIKGNTLYLLKDNVLFQIQQKKIVDICTPQTDTFGLMQTASGIYLLGLKGISSADSCSQIIPYPETVKYISHSANTIFVLTNQGNLYALSDKSWEQIKTFSPGSKLISNFVLTPTAAYVIGNDNIPHYYSSWIKAYGAEEVGIYKGEPVVKLANSMYLYISDKEVAQQVLLTSTDDKCSIYKIDGLIGCSPSFYATLTSTDTISIFTASGTFTSSIKTENLKPSAYFGGSIYLLGDYGVYALPLYEKKIILTIDSKEVNVNGKVSEIDVAPRIMPPGRTFVPLRFISETLGAQVIWDEDDRSITITLGNRSIKLWIGKKTIIVNGETYKMDTTPFIDARAGRTLVPIRFVAEYLGSFVYWIPRTRRVMVVK